MPARLHEVVQGRRPRQRPPADGAEEGNELELPASLDHRQHASDLVLPAAERPPVLLHRLPDGLPRAQLTQLRIRRQLPAQPDVQQARHLLPVQPRRPARHVPQRCRRRVGQHLQAERRTHRVGEGDAIVHPSRSQQPRLLQPAAFGDSRRAAGEREDHRHRLHLLDPLRHEQHHQVELPVGLHSGVDAAHEHSVVQHPQLTRHRAVPVGNGGDDHAANAAQGHRAVQPDGLG